MKIVNANIGKIGACYVGPKCYLNETIRLGEIFLCISRENGATNKPFIWLLGGIEQVTDYLDLARSEGSLEETEVNMLISAVERASKSVPMTAMERLSSILDMELEELSELIDGAQVFVSAPVDGVRDYSGDKPKWLSRSTMTGYRNRI